MDVPLATKEFFATEVCIIKCLKHDFLYLTETFSLALVKLNSEYFMQKYPLKCIAFKTILKVQNNLN